MDFREPQLFNSLPKSLSDLHKIDKLGSLTLKSPTSTYHAAGEENGGNGIKLLYFPNATYQRKL